MSGTGSSIFVDFHLPSATTWFYLALALAVALFVRWRHWASWQNWDIFLLFLLVPGLLYLREWQGKRQDATRVFAQSLGVSIGEAAAGYVNPGIAESVLPWCRMLDAAGRLQQTDRGVRRAYLLLLLGNSVLLLRSLADLAILRRPPFQANLSTDSLVWLTVMLLAVFCVTTALPAFGSGQQPQPGAVLIERADQVLASQPVVEWFFDLERLLAAITVMCHLVIVMGLFWIGYQHFGKAVLGASAALLYLLVPYSAYHARELLHVAPASILVGMIAAYRWPLVAGFLLGLGCVLVNFPIFLAPLWISYYFRKGLLRCLLGLGLAVALIAGALWWGGTLWREWQSVLHWPDWRAWDVSQRPTGEGLWSGLELHYAYRVPLFIAYLVLAVTSVFWPREKNVGHLISLTTALTLGVQFWYGRAGGTYALWYVPLLILLVLRPNFRELEERPALSWRERLRNWWHRLAKRSSAVATPLTPSGANKA